MRRLLQLQHLELLRVGCNAWLPDGLRSFAKAAAAPAKKSGRSKGPARLGPTSRTHAVGCGLLKGEADPELKPDSAYPDWLWTLLDPQPTMKELEERYQGQGLTIRQLRKLWQLQNRERIKTDNFFRTQNWTRPELV